MTAATPTAATPTAAPAATIQNPKVEEIDLGAFDAEYAGQRVRVAVNPSRAFRAAYREACSRAMLGVDDAAFIECLSAVLAMPVSDVGAYVNGLPPDAAQWLLFYTIDNYNTDTGRFETSIPPHLFKVWDDWILRRVKARAAQGVNSSDSETTRSAAA